MASSVAASLMGSSMASSVPPAVEEVSEEGLPIITLEEVKNHFSLQDAWMVVYDRVYNVTSFLAEVCNMAIRVVEFSNRVYKIRKIFA